MFMYVLRRLGIALMVMIGTSMVVYLLLNVAGDPLADLRVSSDPNRDQLIQARIDLLDLDVPPVQRYFSWLAGAIGCAVPGMSCELGKTVTAEPVANALGQALIQTLRLVTAATILAMILGISVGIITAIRQYTAFDYGITFVAFLFFSLPSFWVAVLMKEFVGIQFNDFLADPKIPMVGTLIVGLLVGLATAGAVGGTMKRKVITTITCAVTLVVLLQLMTVTGWFNKPSIGLGGIVILGSAFAVGTTVLLAGLRNRRALYSGLSMVALGAALYFPIQLVLNEANHLIILGLTIVTIAVGMVVGHFFGGYDRGQNRAVAAITAFLVGGLIYVDKVMLHWPSYYDHGRIKGRPIATLGATTPNFNENYWMMTLDAFTHVLLPTMVLLLLGFAGYTRYARATMLETLGQDYVRTARAKGLSERVVIVKHAFRNALVPIATVVAMTIGDIVGGAIITERIFSWSGTGTMFMEGISKVDANPVMGVWLVTSSMSMLFILVADLAYSYLDPRVRVK